MGDRRVEVALREVPQFEVLAYGLIGDVEIMASCSSHPRCLQP